MDITGSTRICAILAHPIHHVRAPEAFNDLMRKLESDTRLVPLHVEPGDLATVTNAIRSMQNVAGFITTVPHKTAMASLCDEVSEMARMVGAVNVVRRTAGGRLIGEILDGIGFVRGLESVGVEVAGKSVLLVGAGGAGSAIAFALAQAGIRRLGIWNRTSAKANELMSRLGTFAADLEVFIGDADAKGFDIVVNSTSIGLNETDPLPFDTTHLSPNQIVADIIMKPRLTAVLKAAEASGCQICFGAPMLDCQLALMAEFMGVHP